MASNIKSVWGVTAPFLVAAASVCTYAHLQGTLLPVHYVSDDRGVASNLEGTLGFVPVVF